MVTHSSTLAWKIPRTEEPGGLQSMESLRVGHDWVTSLSLFTFLHWKGNGNPLQCSCLENPRDRGAWWAAVYGVAQSQTQLKQLSSSKTYFAKYFSYSTGCLFILLIVSFAVQKHVSLVWSLLLFFCLSLNVMCKKRKMDNGCQDQSMSRSFSLYFILGVL